MRRCLIVLAVSLALAPCALAKSGPTLHTRDEIVQVRERCQTDEWAAAQREKAVANAAQWLAMSDEALWDFILDAEIPRALNVNFGVGCPVHGSEIFKKGGHYPWGMSSDAPFKVVCPVGGEVYPSNDYEAYLKGGCKEELDTSQPYVDDGFGYVAPDGKRYWFAATYTFWHRWRKEIFAAMDALNHAYLLTGDPAYAHKLGVMLGRMVEVYPKMDYATQAYHNGQWPAKINGRVLDYIWENGTIKRFGRCYDGIYDAIGDDGALQEFLAARGIADLKKEYEQKVLHFMARDVMEGRIRGNMYYQPTLAELAIVIDNEDPDYGPTKDEMVDWLLYGGGEIELILFSGFDRDGAGGESAPGYSSSWNTNFCTVAELLVKLGVDITANPRWRQVIRFPYNVTIAGNHSPRLGDCGGTIHAGPHQINTTVLKFGYKHFRDPQCAQLLLGQKVFGDSLWGETLDRADVEAVAKSAPDATDLRTRDMGGYGLGVFDVGDGEARRSAWMYYGGPEAWHGHHDRLTLGYTAHGRDFLPEMGYPSHWNDKGERFTRGMPCHYIVEIDQKRSANKKYGYLDYFVAGAKARVMRARAETVYPGTASIYRRTFAMIDSGDGSFLVDLFHVKGGALHDYHFHGLPFGEFSTTGLTFIDTQEGGTLLGEAIEWGEDTSKNSSGYDFFRNVRRHAAPGVWSARWAGRDDCRLTYWMPAFPEVIVCDGEPPAKPDFPDAMEFLVVRNSAEESRFPAVIAPGRGGDVVTEAAFEQDETSITYQVKTPEGEWTIAIDDDGAVSAERLKDGTPEYAFHANRTTFEFGGKHFVLTETPQLTIQSIDYATNTVTVAEPIVDPERLVGEVVVVRPPGVSAHSASYTVAHADAHTLCFEGPARTGLIVIDSTADGTVTTSTRLSGYSVQIAARSFIGMALVQEDLGAAARIIDYATPEGVAAFGLEQPLTFPDTNADGRVLAYFADLAPGYVVELTPWAEVEAMADGEVALRGSLRFKEE
jgi:hypothetical protein